MKRFCVSVLSVMLALSLLLSVCGFAAGEVADTNALAEQARQLFFGDGAEKDTAQAFELVQQALAAEGGEQNALAMYVMGRVYEAGDPVEKDTAAALEWYQKAADLGYGNAMTRIGRMYLYVAGMEDEAAAFEWYHKALENNATNIFYYMGCAYEAGKGVEKDLDAAMEWFGKAVEAGDRITRGYAEEKIAILYLNGSLGQPDEALAEEWAGKAEADGDADAWYYLGRVYALGRGGEFNYAKAKEYYERAAAAGSDYGNAGLCWLYMYGYGVEQDGQTAIAYAEKAMESKDPDTACLAMVYLAEILDKGIGVEQDYDKAMELHKKTVELGYESAYWNVGRRYYSGIGVEKDYAEAVKWFEKAAEVGQTKGLGMCYYYGKGVEKDYAKAMELFLQDVKTGGKSTATGANDSFWYIAYMYEKGYGMAQDYKAALEWYEKGVDSGDPSCMIDAARLYLNGLGTEKNVDRAVELYERAARNNSAVAYCNLAILYESGKDVPKDMDKAVGYYEKAARLGNTYSCGQLGWLYKFGTVIHKDYEKAVYWLQMGVELGSAYCHEQLADLYLGGMGVAKDQEKAAALYETAFLKAVDNDKDVAKRSLSGLKKLGKAVTKIAINEKKVSLLAGGPAGPQEVQLTVTITPETALWKDVEWRSSDENIVTVDANGVLRAVSAGNAAVTARIIQPGETGASVEYRVTVGQAAGSIETDQTEVTVPVNKKSTVKAAVQPANAANKKVDWSSDNEAVATVKNGQITGVSPGTAVITAMAADGCGAAAPVQVTVIQPVAKIETAEKNLTLAAGETAQIACTVLPENATDKTVLWSSDKETVAVVDASGVITAVGAGKCTITGTANDGSKVKVQIKVTVK